MGEGRLQVIGRLLTLWYRSSYLHLSESSLIETNENGYDRVLLIINEVQRIETLLCLYSNLPIQQLLVFIYYRFKIGSYVGFRIVFINCYPFRGDKTVYIYTLEELWCWIVLIITLIIPFFAGTYTYLKKP